MSDSLKLSPSEVEQRLSSISVSKMSTPYNSTSNLIPSTSTSSATSVPKDFSAAFGALSSTYGAGGSAPTPLHSVSIPDSRSHRAQLSIATPKKSWKSRIFPASCQVTPLPASTQQQRRAGTSNAPRDYEAAFGALKTDYGLHGMCKLRYQCTVAIRTNF